MAEISPAVDVFSPDCPIEVTGEISRQKVFITPYTLLTEMMS
jgi:hypothetical protein